MLFYYQMFTILSEIDCKTSHIRCIIPREAISSFKKYTIVKKEAWNKSPKNALCSNGLEY